ncbi:hypothetical protein GQ43DRAFT_68600 [Delitschia confertaspora ATCC 74209]|uniref:Uncharacterized protein n=1 Tax=Delitschia confertaspora ATCC 74209 TaxID=1513339 RepID=A0A9P4JK05_9PLEO|nr:hypothetical protein GQ43DRAFT_68600 [Delitschia confertaspora ATCC 74209]
MVTQPMATTIPLLHYSTTFRQPSFRTREAGRCVAPEELAISTILVLAVLYAGQNLLRSDGQLSRLLLHNGHSLRQGGQESLQTKRFRPYETF